MTRVISRIAAGLAVLSLATAAVAAPQKDHKKPAAKAEAPKCPSCKMDLTTKKDKDHSVAVKIKGKTYYCCAKCPMNKKPPKAKS